VGYVFLFRSEIFFGTIQELEYLFFLSCKARNFFPVFTIRLYDKNFGRSIMYIIDHNPSWKENQTEKREFLDPRITNITHGRHKQKEKK
jgi:hypothetical protein